MKKLSVLLLGLLVFSVGNAFAFPLWPGVGSDPGTKFEDNDFDYFLDLNNDGVINGGYTDNGVFHEGDVLYAAVEFQNAIQLVGGSATISLNKEIDDLVAWTTLQIKSIDATYGYYTMGEYNSTAMVEFYTGGPDNLDVLSMNTSTNNPTLAQAEAKVKDGTFLWSFSIDPNDSDTYWVFSPSAVIANQPNQVQKLNDVTGVGSLSYALNQVGGDDIFNYVKSDGGVAYGIPTQDGLVDLVGNGFILGGGWNGTDPQPNYFATSDIDVSVNPTVIPEPATLSLFGLSLIGLAFVSRRRSRR